MGSWRGVSLALSALVTLSAVALLSGSASAHLPIYSSGGSTMDTALHIPDSNTSYATYAEFKAAPNQIHFYSISVGLNQDQYIEVDVPALDYLEEFAPILIVIGPGLPEPDGNTSEVLAFYGLNLTSGSGALSWRYDGPLDEKEFEPFTQVDLLKRQSVNVTLPQSGLYYIAVAQQPFTPAPNDQYKFIETKYILVTGVLEKFTVLDYVLIPYDWVKGHMFWDESPLVFLLPTYVVLIGGVAVMAFSRRWRPSPSAVAPRRRDQSVFYAAFAGSLLMIGTGVNQLAFLFGNPLFSLGLGESIVLMLQSIGIVMGVIAVRLSFSVLRPARWIRLLLGIIVTVIALIVGAGLIIGPILFVGAAVAGSYIGRPKPVAPSG